MSVFTSLTPYTWSLSYSARPFSSVGGRKWASMFSIALKPQYKTSDMLQTARQTHAMHGRNGSLAASTLRGIDTVALMAGPIAAPPNHCRLPIPSIVTFLLYMCWEATFLTRACLQWFRSHSRNGSVYLALTLPFVNFAVLLSVLLYFTMSCSLFLLMSPLVPCPSPETSDEKIQSKQPHFAKLHGLGVWNWY